MAAVDQRGREFLTTEREDRLNSYRSTPQDINAHYSDEGQIQSDYHKRFAFELIQNADDAMRDVNGTKTVRFEVHDGVLLVANTGRPINEDDVTALCTMSYTTKDAEDDQRASIGHKGRGFSSVLEITEQPQVYSTGISFTFDRDRSHDAIQEVVDDLEEWSMEQIDGIPLMRLPFPPQKTPERVKELLDQGYNTVFRFPLADAQVEQDVIETVVGLDRNTVLFLQELKRLEISVEDREERWTIDREQKPLDSDETELTFVSVRHLDDDREDGDEETFALFSRDEVEIGRHTSGIDENTWGDVNYTQIGLALRVEERDDGTHLTKLAENPFIHVFLPTEERCAIPVLVNGAFHTAISRTNINVTSDADNYNGFLLQQVANLLATDVRQYVAETATTVEEFIECLDFTHLSVDAIETDTLNERFIDAVRTEFADVALIPRLEKLATGEILTDPGEKSVSDIVVPYYAAEQPAIAEAVARIYGNDKLEVDGLGDTGWFPKTTLLEPDRAAILEGLGAQVLEPEEVPVVLGSVPDMASPLYKYPEPEDELAVDPILQVLIWIWRTISGKEDVVDRFKTACREAAVFPVGTPDNGVVQHVAKPAETEFFLPPRRELPNIELSGIQFLTPPVYRPETSVDTQTQSELVEDLKPGLEAIWDVNEFDFEEVVQAAVFPKLPSPQNPDADDTELRNLEVLDLIRRLAQRSVDADQPLPFVERDGTLHRLCLLPVPTRDGEWRPAYTVYFGEEWQPDTSRAKRIGSVLDEAGISDAAYVASPEALPGSVAYDAEEETLFEEWKRFFLWLGVAPHIRLKPFFDPREERKFTATHGIERPETGSLLARLKNDDWEAYQSHLRQKLDQSGKQRNEYDSIYQLQGIEYFNQFVEAATSDKHVAELFFKHIVSWWEEDLRGYRHPVLATSDQSSWSHRNQNCPLDGEERRVGLNLWLWQLKRATWCPSNRGRVKPEEVWLPTESVRTRFELHGTVLLPVLSEQVLDTVSEARDLLHTLGVRPDVSQKSFRPNDAALIARTVADMFGDKNDEVIADSLREIKPVYRYLSELLPGLDQSRTITADEWVEAQERLQGIEVLSREEGEGFVFASAQQTYFVRSPDVLDRIPVEGIPVFVLQEDEAVRFGSYFGMRDLEGEAEADPRFVDDGDGDEKTDEVVTFLQEVAPFILCRLEAERPSQELIDQDINGMNAFLDHLTVVDDIEVDYRFGSEDDATVISSDPDFFLDRRGRKRNEPALPFVKNAPDRETQNRLLARALCEYLEVSQFEGIITLLNAETNEQRRQYLKLAGAPATRDDVDGKRRALFEDESTAGPTVEFDFEEDAEAEGLQTETATEDVGNVEQELQRRKDQETRDYPVYDVNELEIQGGSITITTEPAERDSGEGSDDDSSGSGQGSNVTVSQDYRSKVDALGMSVTLQYERNRLREEYGCTTPEDYVLDVHREDLIAEAREDPIAGPVLTWLEEEAGLPLPFPGFDILTVNPDSGEADRLIELKSSGHDLRTPSVTWNEWKTASTSTVQDLYYLYIVGNLRKDITSEPYLRELPNPFALLNAETEETVTKEIKVMVTSFKKEAHIKETRLTVDDIGST